jgi:hypothetical protein
MSNSSAQLVYSTISPLTSSDTITIAPLDPATLANISVATGGLSNITISTGMSGAGTYAIGSGLGTTVGGTINVSGGAGSTYYNSTSQFSFGDDWVHKFPEFDRIQRMCKEYPGLKIAYEKFKTTYHLVKDHYDTPEDQRPVL